MHPCSFTHHNIDEYLIEGFILLSFQEQFRPPFTPYYLLLVSQNTGSSWIGGNNFTFGIDHNQSNGHTLQDVLNDNLFHLIF